MADWQNDINNYPLVPVTTGDGNEYKLKMKFRGGSVDPLTAVYNYAGKIGSKPARNSSASPVYDLTFYIPQDIFKAWLLSVQTPDSEWTVKHPLYGDLKGHPTNLNWDNTTFDDVEFTVQFQQAITDDTPSIAISFRDRLSTQNLIIRQLSVDDFTDKVPSVEEKNILAKFVDDLEQIYTEVLNNDYIDKFYDLRQTLEAAVFVSSKFIELVDDVLNIASTLTLEGILYPLTTRFGLMDSQAVVIQSVNEDVDTTTPDGNQSDIIAIFKQSAGGSNVGATSTTIVTPSESQADISGFDVTDVQDTEAPPDYKYKKDVDATIENANQLLNDYIVELDSFDITTEGFKQFTPSNDMIEAVTASNNFAIQEVKDLAIQAKEESIYRTESDTTPELLAFKLYGSASDENVNEIINANDLLGKITLGNSWRNLVIKKNTNIIYFQ